MSGFTTELNETLKEVGDDLARVGKKIPELEHKAEKIPAIERQTDTLSRRLDEIEQRQAAAGGGEWASRSFSVGQTLLDERGTDLERISRESGRVSLGVKAALTGAADSAGAFAEAARDGVSLIPQRRRTVRDLLTVIGVDQTNSVEHVQQTDRTNAAAPVAEGAAKQESSYAFELVSTPIRTIAHWTKASRQVLSDSPQLRRLIDTELLNGLMLVEEAQLLNGDGTGQNLDGLVTQATAYSAPFDPAGTETEIDKIGLAVLQASLTELPADGIIIHPSDWMRMLLLKDTAGAYLIGNPQDRATPALFGLPVVVTQAIAVDKFLVGNFAAQHLYDRWEARVEVGFVNDDFTKNLVTVLAEERIGLAVRQPASLIYGDFGNVT